MIEYKWGFYETKSLIQEEKYSFKHDKKIGELFTDRITASDICWTLQKRSKGFVYMVRQSTKAD